MPDIPNIPQSMITEHVNWHTRPGNPAAGGRNVNPWPPMGGGPTAGSGEEFLVWHQGYVQRFGQWVQGLAANQRPPAPAIAPWTAIPTMFKMGMVGWSAARAEQEEQLVDMSNFATLDDLGRFLEWGLHGFLHSASAAMWSEPVILGWESPRSTYFWQIHGLIDHWRQRWVNANQGPQPPQSLFTSIAVNGGNIAAAIGTPGEIDRFEFSVSSATDSRHTIETSGPTDVVMYLAGPNNPRRLITWNDDGGQGTNARLSLRLSPATYYVYIVHFDRQNVGNYNITVTSP